MNTALVVLQMIGALGGVGTFGTVVWIAFRAGQWKSEIDVRIETLATRLVRQNHVDDRLFGLVGGMVQASACSERHAAVAGELGRVEARLDGHINAS